MLSTNQNPINIVEGNHRPNIIEPSPYFQRSIALEYDIASSEFIDFFVPTPASVEALEKVIAGTVANSRDRSHVLLGAYGTGKSLLGLIIAGIVNPQASIKQSLINLRLNLTGNSWLKLAEQVSLFLESKTPNLLPIILSGNQDNLELALNLATRRALKHSKLEIKPPGIFRAATNTIERWRNDWPEVYARWEKLASIEFGKNVAQLETEINSSNLAAYQVFCEIYPQLTAGAAFDPFAEGMGNSVVEMLKELSTNLLANGWGGLVIIWDEFGRFLEERASQPFGKDAQLLQELAESCNRSGLSQMHLVLITHKSLRQYGRGLVGGLDKEWSKIEGRFSNTEISSDPTMVYHLIERGLRPVNANNRVNFISQNVGDFDTLTALTATSSFFSDIPDDSLRQLIVEGAYPLHPITTYCLPRLSDRVAQNQRTLFTFLAAEDENGLLDLWQKPLELYAGSLPIVLPGHLFDYFANGIKSSTEPGGVHWIWSVVERARTRIPTDDQQHYNWLMQIIKALAILHVAHAYDGTAVSTQLIAFSMGASNGEIEKIETGLYELAGLRQIRYRKSYGGWEFIQWQTDFIIEQEITVRLQEQPPSSTLLKNLLTTVLPPPVYQARRYNDQFGMIRYFDSQYRTIAELEADVINPPDWEALLTTLDYSDGLIIYILSFTPEELNRANQVAATISSSSSRVICVVPSQPLAAYNSLQDLYGLKQIANDPRLQADWEEAERELKFFEEDINNRLELELAGLIDPRHNTHWYVTGHLRDDITNPGAVSKLLSAICESVFSDTPRIYNESYNRRNPATVQIRAAEKVIDALLGDPTDPDLGLTGYGPDVAIMNAALKTNGLISTDGKIAPPNVLQNPKMAKVWQECQDFYHRSSHSEAEGLNFEELITILKKPPFGLRNGVLPLILAVTLNEFASSAVIRRSGSAVALNGTTFTEIVSRPTVFTVKVENISPDVLTILDELELKVAAFLRQEEHKEQRLRFLSLGFLRWLQSLPRYARDSNQVSKNAASLRRIIRASSTDPAHSLLVDLPRLVNTPAELTSLMIELESLFETLVEQIAEQIIKVFGNQDSKKTYDEAKLADLIAAWFNRINNIDNANQLFSEPVSEELGKIGRSPENYRLGLIDTLGKKVTGTLPRDWNDELFQKFCTKLLESRLRVELEIALLMGETKNSTKDFEASLTTQPASELTQIVTISLELPGDEVPSQYKFQKSPKLSTHGHQLAESLKRTIEISGRSLDISEKRTIALEILRYILEGKV